MAKITQLPPPLNDSAVRASFLRTVCTLLISGYLAWIKRLIEALNSKGYSVWRHRDILRVGEPFDQVIEEALDKVNCVLAVW